jgi:alkyldihydroxyacetonephosphate synthase
MKRWNGWGDSSIPHPLSPAGLHLLRSHLGELTPFPDADLQDVLASVPPSRLPDHSLIDKSADVRLLHARGQSLPDWIALRSGRISTFPDGVAFPTDDSEIRALLEFSSHNNIHVIPYGGGTSVVGHINPQAGEAPVLTLSMARMNKLIHLDEVSQMATFQSGVTGPQLENSLKYHGYTLGHFPQSFEYSTLGGWIATRSSGQQSYFYGRIEDLFAGGVVESPQGRLDLPHFPASAAGPDLRQIVLGSEGRIGVITQAQVRIKRLPQAEAFFGVFFHDWQSGFEAVRQIVQSGLNVSMLRFSNPLETEVSLALSGKERLMQIANRGLRILGYGSQRCLLVYGVTGTADHVQNTHHVVDSLSKNFGGLPSGTLVGNTWRKSRFLTPYLRNTLWEEGVTVDTFATALPWSQVLPATEEILQAMHQAALLHGEKVLAIAHLSHVYPDGASIYVTYLLRRTANPDDLFNRWQNMKDAYSLAIQHHGGTISHQHGIGVDHASYLPAEKGPLGMLSLKAICQVFDPAGIMNPGKLF